MLQKTVVVVYTVNIYKPLNILHYNYYDYQSMFFYLVWFAGFSLLVWKNQVGQILRHAKINIG